MELSSVSEIILDIERRIYLVCRGGAEIYSLRSVSIGAAAAAAAAATAAAAAALDGGALGPGDERDGNAAEEVGIDANVEGGRAFELCS